MKKNNFKKLTTIALACSALFSGTIKDEVKTNKLEPIKKEITCEFKGRRRNEKKSVLEPSFPEFDSIYKTQPNPFFSPTRSQRIKNKINKRIYG